MIKEEDNYIVNLAIRVDFSDMPFIPIFRKAYKPLSDRGGIYDTWYALDIQWLFIRIKPMWKIQWKGNFND